ncbi:MAG: DotU family type IV/VI secretion system protein [Nannocystaceae bacterium]
MDWSLQVALPAFEIAGAMDRGDAGDPHRLRGDAEAILDGLRLDSAGREAGYRAEEVAQVRLAIVALLDEAALRRPGPVRELWERRPLLQQRYIHEHLTTAGDRFFEVLEGLLEARGGGDAALGVLRVYCLCLAFGFRGRYAAGGDAAALTMIRRRLERRLGAMVDEPLAPPKTPPVAVVRPAAPSAIPRVVLALSLVFIALAWVLHVRGRGDELTRLRAHIDDHRARLSTEIR